MNVARFPQRGTEEAFCVALCRVRKLCRCLDKTGFGSLDYGLPPAGDEAWERKET